MFIIINLFWPTFNIFRHSEIIFCYFFINTYRKTKVVCSDPCTRGQLHFTDIKYKTCNYFFIVSFSFLTIVLLCSICCCDMKEAYVTLSVIKLI